VRRLGEKPCLPLPEGQLVIRCGGGFQIGLCNKAKLGHTTKGDRSAIG
jgi:hypothetical protein